MSAEETLREDDSTHEVIEAGTEQAVGTAPPAQRDARLQRSQPVLVRQQNPAHFGWLPGGVVTGTMAFQH